MEKDPKHNTSLISINGESNKKLHLLANLYHEPFDSESVLSVVATLAHKPDVKWNIIYSTETWCTSMDQSQGGTVFVVSMEGEMHVFQNATWDIVNLECPEGLNSVWAANDNEAFAVGLKGERVHIIGRNFSVTHDSEGRRLNGVHGISPSNVFAVGDDGLILHFDGSAWHELDSPTNYNLLAVLCKSNTEVYIGGAGGILLRWNGVDWERFPGPKITITSLAIFQDVLYAAAGLDGVYQLSTTGLETFKDLLLYRLKKINELLFGVGNRMVAQFDGMGWWGGDLDL